MYICIHVYIYIIYLLLLLFFYLFFLIYLIFYFIIIFFTDKCLFRQISCKIVVVKIKIAEKFINTIFPRIIILKHFQDHNDMPTLRCG